LREKILKILKENWGYDAFRPLQEDIILSVLDGKDCLALLPTGGGKSICFQVPAIAKEGICLVITPLIALMKDQVENLNKKNIPAAAIYSGMSYQEIDTTFDNAIYGKYKFLYVSPERLETDIFISRAERIPVNLIAIDEAHCISQWGYDFRPPYLNIANIRKYYPKVPFLALTATATKSVKEDIVEKLEFRTKKIFQKSFDRDNLIYGVSDVDAKIKKIVDILKKVKGSGIVYVGTRKRAKEISDFLKQNQISADYYHAGLKQENRNIKQDNWIKNKTRIIVSTNAFGMGIDKPDVRIVIHADIPESLEAYYQEAGRAGRDLKKSYAVLLFNKNDPDELKKKIELNYPELKEVRKIYNMLGNYFQIPIGGGKNLDFDFDISQFCKQYEIDLLLTYNTLKVLEKEGLILLSKDIGLPAKLYIKISYSELYDFQLKNPKFEHLVKTILRSYPGLFDNYININLPDLSKRADIEETQLVKALEFLKKNQILDFVPQKNKPQLTFLSERLQKEHILTNNKNYYQRKKIFRDKIDYMLSYAQSEDACKSRVLLKYFDESMIADCGHCDYCLKKKRKEISHSETIEIQDQVFEILKDGKLSLNDLTLQLSMYNPEEVNKIIKWMIDERKIIIDITNHLYLPR
jgi:ATP-dependent DNA helicase RecQ